MLNYLWFRMKQDNLYLEQIFHLIHFLYDLPIVTQRCHHIDTSRNHLLLVQE